MDPISSDGCRLCLDPFAESFTTIDNPELEVQMQKVFCFSIEPKQGYSSAVCQSCAYAISEFYQYSEKVRQNQEALNGNVTNWDSILDTKITFESVKVETLSDAGRSETTEDDCGELNDEVSEEEVPNSSDDELYKPPSKESQVNKQKRRPGKRKLDDSKADIPKKNPQQTVRKTTQTQKEEDQLFNKHFRMVCDLCGISAATFTALRSHFRKEHNGRVGYVVCCNKKLLFRCSLMDHIDFHANPDVFRCDVCGKKYNNKESLKKHVTIQHSGKNRTMVCATCGKELMGEDSFRYHMNYVHNADNGEVQCDICLKKYPHSRALYQHKLKTHAEPKHECEFCGKKCKTLIALKEHRTTHTGDAMFACQFCGKPNTRKHGLYMHIKRRHPNEPMPMELIATQKSGPKMEGSPKKH